MLFRSATHPTAGIINPVVDEGCPSSVAGLRTAAALADRLNIALELNPIRAPFFHFFGPPGNSSKGAWTVASWLMPVSFASGHQLKIPIACVPGDDPILLGADFLDNCILDNPSNKLIHVAQDGKRHECHTYKLADGHRYLEVAPRQEGQQQFALLKGRW